VSNFPSHRPGPGIWAWQFRIGDKIKTGKTEAKLNLLRDPAGSASDRPRTEESAQERLRDSGN